ncbi:hypothetical protein N0V93_005154 [Gnomoniopsis smithogilvyi]|uniref:Uncharacterized protein n=1 Tax=Gnomoniopsis smithogilvyi TaxID=1191159 RepID=A0A9W9CXW0_9PEZI|nr:hypothetical protein N0V93_005154 [Gnomoniopsis smithogilvyi]
MSLTVALSPEEQDVLDSPGGIPGSSEVKSTGGLPIGYDNITETAAVYVQPASREDSTKQGAVDGDTQKTNEGPREGEKLWSGST